MRRTASADAQDAGAVCDAGDESDDAEHDSEGGEAFSAFVSSEGGKQQYPWQLSSSRGESGAARIRVAQLAQWRCCWCEALSKRAAPA